MEKGKEILDFERKYAEGEVHASEPKRLSISGPQIETNFDTKAEKEDLRGISPRYATFL